MNIKCRQLLVWLRPKPLLGMPLDPAGTSVLQTLHCPPLEKILRAPMGLGSCRMQGAGAPNRLTEQSLTFHTSICEYSTFITLSRGHVSSVVATSQNFMKWQFRLEGWSDEFVCSFVVLSVYCSAAHAGCDRVTRYEHDIVL